ncbi:NAD(P)/FAD-dependent oxidoreductase [Kribbia dieselivorans]|uniref:NAD(P)/FAD-dependent oxidoreductase n=1 Tax=Kribbia dieselivorans TaxID=331526 RepID=UPI00083853DF|nr:FAD-dependent oxidoreductase [Kribbia dieselivorans]
MSSEPIVIVGGGLTAARAIEAIRESEPVTPIILIGNEDRLPYERPPLSKGIMLGKDSEEVAYTHPREWYDERKVDLRLGVTAERLHPESRMVALSDGSEVHYDRLLLATGSVVRKLTIPGHDLNGVHYLRTMGDAEKIRARLIAGGRVVIVGAGWIGLEVAAAARAHGVEVTIVEPQPTPLYGVVGEKVGAWFADLHRGHGVNLKLGVGVTKFEGGSHGEDLPFQSSHRKVTAVVTSEGERLPADMVVVGVGILPNTALAESAGLAVDNGIVVNSSLKVGKYGIWAAGDVANWYNPTFETRMRVEHWANAYNGGYTAGQSMTGQEVTYGRVPFFYSDQYDVGLEYAGFVPRDVQTEVVLRGDPATNAFMAFWVTAHASGHRVLAGMHVNVWDTVDAIKALVRNYTVVDLAKLADPGVPLDAVAAGR